MASEAEKARKAAWYQENKERMSARRLARRRANPAKVNAENRAYSRANRERVSANKRAWRQANLEKVRATEKAYRDANRERSLEAARRRAEIDRSFATRSWAKWTPSEDALVLSDYSDLQVSSLTGRTRGSIRTRRNVLKKAGIHHAQDLQNA